MEVYIYLSNLELKDKAAAVEVTGPGSGAFWRRK